MIGPRKVIGAKIKIRTKCDIFVLTSATAKINIRLNVDVQDAPCDPCMVHCCLHWCAICQERREMKHHLDGPTSSDATMVDPPQVQEMNATDKKKKPADKDEPSSSSSDEGHTNLQLQPI